MKIFYDSAKRNLFTQKNALWAFLARVILEERKRDLFNACVGFAGLHKIKKSVGLPTLFFKSVVCNILIKK